MHAARERERQRNGAKNWTQEKLPKRCAERMAIALSVERVLVWPDLALVFFHTVVVRVYFEWGQNFCSCSLWSVFEMHNQFSTVRNVQCLCECVILIVWSSYKFIACNKYSSKKFAQRNFVQIARHFLSSTQNHLHTKPNQQHTHTRSEREMGNRSWMNVLVTTENLIACKFSFLRPACHMLTAFTLQVQRERNEILIDRNSFLIVKCGTNAFSPLFVTHTHTHIRSELPPLDGLFT